MLLIITELRTFRIQLKYLLNPNENDSREAFRFEEIDTILDPNSSEVQSLSDIISIFSWCGDW